MTMNGWLIAGGLLLAGLFLRARFLARGIPQYSAADIARKRAAGEALLLLDVRTSGERAAASIPGSRHIPVSELGSRLGELGSFRDAEIICYCASGARSASAARMLKGRGFRSANLAGGMLAWRDAG